ncbi:MAG: potassium channel family protein [Actinomycetota bacterium]|nr:potassium channel family protein [Actinomycetota bacterium]
MLLALRASPLPRPWPTLIGVVALAGSAAAFGATQAGTEAGVGAAQIWKGLMLLLTAILIVRRVLAKPTVTVQSIYGALSAYIIIGLMFAAFYAAIWHLGGPPFFADGKAASSQTFQYFSFTTLTTLGYGDYTAVGESGQAIAVLEALTGQVFLATLVARLVAAFRTPGDQARPAVSRRRPSMSVRDGAGGARRRNPAGSGRRPSARTRNLPVRKSHD